MTALDMKYFGDLFRAGRKAKGLTQVRAAGQMKIDYRHYQNIEGGKVNITWDTLKKICDYYGITILCAVPGEVLHVQNTI